MTIIEADRIIEQREHELNQILGKYKLNIETLQIEACLPPAYIRLQENGKLECFCFRLVFTDYGMFYECMEPGCRGAGCPVFDGKIVPPEVAKRLETHVFLCHVNLPGDSHVIKVKR